MESLNAISAVIGFLVGWAVATVIYMWKPDDNDDGG